MSTSKRSSRTEVKAPKATEGTASARLVDDPESALGEDESRPTTLPDGTPVLGDEVSGTIPVEYRTRVPHPGERKRRRLAFPLLIEAELRGRAKRAEEPMPTDDEVAAEVQRLLDEAAERRLDIDKAINHILPEITAPDAAAVNREVEAAAVLRLPVMIWAWLRLLLYTSGPKTMPMWRRLAVATALRMALVSVRPCCKRILEEFCKENRFRAWAFLWPGHPPTYPEKNRAWELSAFHKQIKKVLSRANPYEMWAHVNRSMLLELLGEHRIHPKHGGYFANCRDALTYITADAIMIEADLPQEKPRSLALARMIRGAFRKRCGYVQYTDAKGSVTRKCHGYKWVQLSLTKLGGLVLHGKLFRANINEREAVEELLIEAFRYWPELKDQKDIFLVGDALYDQKEKFAYDLIFRWGIHPVFPRAGSISGEYEFAAGGGVPKCSCGTYATIKDAPGFPTPWERKKAGLADPGNYVRDRRGEVIDNARIRWVCAKGKAGCGFTWDAYPRQNARLYTYLPHRGNHSRAALRFALLNYRNTIESSFSMLKDMGLAGKSQDRPKWAGDDQMDHLVWMTVVTMTGRRLVHANGLYEQVWEEATKLGLMRASMPTEGLAPMLTPTQWATLEQSLRSYAKAPAGWPEIEDTPNSDIHKLRQT